MSAQSLDFLSLFIIAATFAGCILRWHSTSKKYNISATKFKWYGFFAALGGFLAFLILGKMLFSSDFFSSIVPGSFRRNQYIFSLTLTTCAVVFMVIFCEL